MTNPPPPASPSARARPWRLLVLGCLALAAASLLLARSPTYDPWAWLIWGREIVHWDLDTTAGPSWKPLPVLFTTVFSLAGDDAAPLLWLVVARAGGLLAVAFAYRIAARIAGPAAGVIAAAALILSEQFVTLVTRGNSEGLLVALALWAVERHLDGRRRDAFALGVAAALLRPEVWPFVALYGAWLIRGDRQRARSWRTLIVVAGCGVAVIVLWLVPEYLGSGNLLRAASRAREPVPNSPAESDHPFLAVFTNSARALPWPVYVGGVVAVLGAAASWWRERRANLVLWLAAIATVLMVTVAVLAEVGFTGNLRYVSLPAALVCVLGGVGWAQLASASRRRYGAIATTALAVVVVAISAPSVLHGFDRLHYGLQRVRDEDRLSAQLPSLIARAGGRDAVIACAPVFTGPFQTQLLAWHLRLHQDQVRTHPSPPGTIIVPRSLPPASDVRFPERAATSLWVLRSSCARAQTARR